MSGSSTSGLIGTCECAELAGWYATGGGHGKSAIILDIKRQPGANIVDVVESIKRLLPNLQSSLPPALKIEVVTDRTTTIRAAIADVQLTLRFRNRLSGWCARCLRCATTFDLFIAYRCSGKPLGGVSELRTSGQRFHRAIRSCSL
jgi:hypothetical protein